MCIRLVAQHLEWLAFIMGATLSAAAPCESLRHFTVVDEIGLTHFGDPYTGDAETIQISPDGRYLAVVTERGRIDLDRPEDILRIYDISSLRRFVVNPDGSQTLAPVCEFTRSTDKDGPIITHWLWLKDSSGIAYLERGAHGGSRLALADLKTKTINILTADGETIKAFDIRDREHYVYAVADPGLLRRDTVEDDAAAIVGTGRSLEELLFPADKYPNASTDRSELWAVVGGEPFRVRANASDQTLTLFQAGLSSLTLSPDGQFVVTALAVAEIPLAWEKLYPPTPTQPPLRAGVQDLSTTWGNRLASRYVRIELQTGAAQLLSDAPAGTSLGWWTGAKPAWSPDGKSVLLPDLFVNSDRHGSARACVAVVDLTTRNPSCVQPLKGPDERGRYEYEGDRYDTHARFLDSEGRRVSVSFWSNHLNGFGKTEYRQSLTGTWAVVKQSVGEDQLVIANLEIRVREGLNDPPVLYATESKTHVSRVIWNPNPQLNDIALGKATVYRWKDRDGRDWKGGLFKPVPYESGRRYPLVIQTHGFSETEFRPSGIYPTAFAARALAGAGFVVLQVHDCAIRDTTEEGPCNVVGYEAAVSELVKAGLVDSERIGLIGFSRTCFYVMKALTTSTLRIKAASVTAGVLGSYLQYMTEVDIAGVSDDADAIVGARPFAEGLQQWTRHAPLFNMDKVGAALQVVAEGRSGLTDMWEPYAAMRYLHKPVDLILLNDDEHVLTNPRTRLASQGGSVDWFRFWLQDYEDPDPTKAEQYQRWRELRKLRDAQDARRADRTAESLKGRRLNTGLAY
jgi:dipeptidyl aminopeptidase/acylaminoacyl peptidase